MLAGTQGNIYCPVYGEWYFKDIDTQADEELQKVRFGRVPSVFVSWGAPSPWHMDEFLLGRHKPSLPVLSHSEAM